MDFINHKAFKYFEDDVLKGKHPSPEILPSGYNHYKWITEEWHKERLSNSKSYISCFNRAKMCFKEKYHDMDHVTPFTIFYAEFFLAQFFNKNFNMKLVNNTISHIWTMFPHENEALLDYYIQRAKSYPSGITMSMILESMNIYVSEKLNSSNDYTTMMTGIGARSDVVEHEIAGWWMTFLDNESELHRFITTTII